MSEDSIEKEFIDRAVSALAKTGIPATPVPGEQAVKISTADAMWLRTWLAQLSRGQHGDS